MRALCEATSMFTRRANRFCWSDGRDERVDLCGRACDDRLAGRGVHRKGHARVVREHGLGRLGVQRQQRYCALPPSRDISCDRVAISLSPSAAVNAPATTAAVTSPIEWPMTASGVTPWIAKGGQRQLQAHDHRLHPRIPTHRLPLGEHLLQREANVLGEKRFQFGDRISEHGLVGKQLPAHSDPLRPLAGIHENGARAAHTSCGPTTPSAGLPAASAARPAIAWAALRAQTVAN